MDSKNGLVPFSLLIVLFAFSFVLSLDALSMPTNTFYGILALVGFIVCIVAGFFLGVLSRRDGEAIALWFSTYGVVVTIIFIWYLTRVGTAIGWW